MLCVVTTSLISVLVVYMVLQMDKFYNTPLINYISRVSLTSVCAIIIGVLYFKEKYNIQHIIGILMTIAGIYFYFYFYLNGFTPYFFIIVDKRESLDASKPTPYAGIPYN